jgi:aspartyl protease family protein
MRAGFFFAILFGGVLVASVANEMTSRDALAGVGDPGLNLESQPAGVAWLVKNEDGHFYAESMVATGDRGGSRVRFVIDTGASLVALTRTDAERVGLDADTLAFDARVRTANGEARAARVRLASVSVSGVKLEDVDALVLEEGLSQSLLGMSYLGRLSKIEAAGDALVLRR